jgi:hypothetical protein
MRGWVMRQGFPSWELSKKIILFSNINTIQIVPLLELRPDVTNAYNKENINYDHSGFTLKILRQNIPNDYFNIKLEAKSKDFIETIALEQMIYI